MIYCASCKKPSARESGACPHCGRDLQGKTAAPAVKTAPQTPPSKAEATRSAPPAKEADKDSAHLASGDAGFDLGRLSESGLELAADDYIPPDTGRRGGATVDAPKAAEPPGGAMVLPPASPGQEDDLQLEVVEEPESNTKREKAIAPKLLTEIDESEIRKVAGFGDPGDGPIGAIKYWWKVRGRLGLLVNQKNSAGVRRSETEERRDSIRAALGRRGYLWVNDKSTQPLVDEAVKLEGELQGAERSRSNLESEHRDKVDELQAAIDEIKNQMAPVRDEEATASAKLQGLTTDMKRLEAKHKRAEIELRNVRELIEKRQTAYGDLEKPKEEREKLLADIADLDKKQPEISKRIKFHADEVEALREPLREAREMHKEVMGRLSVENEKLAAIKQEKDQVEMVFQQSASSARERIKGESMHAQKAWAALGAKMMATHAGEHPELAELEGKLKIAEENDAEAGHALELLELAAEDYNKDVFQKGRTLTMMCGAGVGLVVVILICVAIL